MAACGEAEDADALRIDMPACGIRTRQPQSALGIQQRDGVAQQRQAILQDDACDAVFIEPFGDGVTLPRGDVPDVAAARAEDDGGAVSFACRRQKDLQWQRAVLKSSVAIRSFARPEGDALRWGGISRVDCNS